MRIGVDLGGTKIEGIALDKNGKELVRHRIESPRGDYLATLSSIRYLVDIVEKRAMEIEMPNIRATIGVGIPGTISPASGLVKNSNSTWLIGQRFDKDIADTLERPVKVENDANCFVRSEATDGAAMGSNIVFGAILGTGVGGGLFVDGKVRTGLNSITGEWGHNQLPWPTETDDGQELHGAICYCGQRACIETFLSGDGLRRSHATLSGNSIGDPQSTLEIVKLSNNGNFSAKRALEIYATRLAKSLAQIINILDPDVIVLGGGLSNIEFLYERVPNLWLNWIFSDETETRLVKNMHGSSSGVRGAAWLWSDEDAEVI